MADARSTGAAPAAGPGRPVVQAARAALTELGRVLVPQQCPGCGTWDVALCASCGAGLAGPVRRVESGAPRLHDARHGPLPVWGVASYEGPVRAAVVAWKDRGRADLGPVLEGVLERAAAGLAPTLGQVCDGSELLLVPVPSTAGARRRRGADLVGRLAAAAARGLTTAGQEAQLAAVLARRRGVRDQVGLGARGRGRNTASTVAARRGAAPGAGRWCLVVDDVLTTGSTVAACTRVLASSGALVVGALVLAATPAPVDAGEV